MSDVTQYWVKDNVTRYWVQEKLEWDDEDTELANQTDAELNALGYVAVYKASDCDRDMQTIQDQCDELQLLFKMVAECQERSIAAIAALTRQLTAAQAAIAYHEKLIESERTRYKELFADSEQRTLEQLDKTRAAKSYALTLEQQLADTKTVLDKLAACDAKDRESDRLRRSDIERRAKLESHLAQAVADNAALLNEISGAMDSLESEIPAERKARWERLQALFDVDHPGTALLDELVQLREQVEEY